MNKTSAIKINLGCGQDIRPGWINLDALAKFKPDVVHDLLQPLPFANDFADYILAQDILEHFIKEDLEKLLMEVARVMKVGAKLEVRVPNLDDIFERFRKDPETRNQFIYGTTAQTGIFGVHKLGFTPQLLVSLMLKNNLRLVSWRGETTNYVAIFSKIKSVQKTKKLILVNQTLGMGGAEVFLSDLLAELRWDITAYTNHQNFKKLLIAKGIKTQRVSVVVDIIGDYKGLIKAFFLWPILVGKYWQIIKKHSNADLFLVSGFPEKIFFSPLAKLMGKPVCWIEFGPMTTVFKKFFYLPKVLYFLVKNIPEVVVTPSLNSLNNLTAEARLSLAKLRVIPCGRNLPVLKQSLLKKNNLHEQNEQKNLVVCVSRLEKGKGQDLLIRAFGQVVKKIPSAKLRIVGEGDFRVQLEKLITHLNLTKSVQLTGWVENSLAEMTKGQVVVFPSVWSLEGFGLVMIEALSLGKSVVAFKTGPVPEIITDEENGLLVEYNQQAIKVLAEKITLFLKSPNLRARLGKQAQQDFKQKYTIVTVAQQYNKVFTEAIFRHQAQLQLDH